MPIIEKNTENANFVKNNLQIFGCFLQKIENYERIDSMKFGFNNHIRVLFDSPRATESTQSKQAEVGKNKTLESRDVIDTKKLDNLTKELLDGYIKEPSRQKAVNLLTSYLQQKEKELQNNPTLLKSLKEKAEKIKILSNYD